MRIELGKRITIWGNLPIPGPTTSIVSLEAPSGEAAVMLPAMEIFTFCQGVATCAWCWSSIPQTV